MFVSFKKITALSTKNLGIYTLQLNDDKLSEFEKFDALDLTHHQAELKNIWTILKKMGLRKAKPYYFRPERGAEALPALRDVPVELLDSGEDYGVRLYCIRLTDNLLILLNGGIKTTLDPERCPNVKDHFRNAHQLSTAITKAKLQGLLHWDPEGTEISSDEDPIEI